MPPVVVKFGPFRLDATKRLLLRDGEPIALTPKAFDALVLLVERRDHVVSKQELLSALWPDTAVEEATLSQHVFMVRRALSDSGNDARYVATIARRGYRFIAPAMPIEPRGDGAAAEAYSAAAADAVPHRGIWAVAALMAATAFTTAVVTWNVRGRGPQPRVVRLAVPLAADQRLGRPARGAPALSADGRSIAYAANGQLYLRRLDDDDAYPIPGTNLDASMPFFSPDGRWVGFWSAHDSTLKTIAVGGGAAVSVGPASNPRGASWFGDLIVVAEGGEGVVTLPVSGGDRARWIAPDPSEMLRSPQVLPGGDAVLFTAAAVTGNRMTRTDVVAYSRATHVRKILIPNARAARYVGGDSIVYAIGTTLFGARFDRHHLELAGDPIAIAKDASTLADFDAAADGSVIYVGGADADRTRRRLAIVDAGGMTHPTRAPVSSYQNPRVSPDGKRLAFATDDDGGTIWICGLADAMHAQRLTFRGWSNFPVWSPDGRRIAFGSSRPGEVGIFVQPADGTRAAARITAAEPGFEHQPASWSADGSTLVFVNVKAGIKDTIWTVTLDDSHRTTQILAVRGSNQMDPAISPDQRWIAYMSEGEAGDSTPQVYVQPFPVTGRKVQVSRGGGDMPAWSHDGTRLFFHDVTSRKLMAVGITTGATLAFDDAVVAADDLVGDGGYDASPDGRVVAAVDDRPPAAQRINVVLNWFVEMKDGATKLERHQPSRVSRRTVPVSVSLPIDR